MELRLSDNEDRNCSKCKKSFLNRCEFLKANEEFQNIQDHICDAFTHDDMTIYEIINTEM